MNEYRVNKAFAQEIEWLFQQLGEHLRAIRDPQHAPKVPSAEEAHASFVNAVEVAVKDNRVRIEELRTSNRAEAPAKKGIDEEMQARAIAEMERHEKRQVAKDEQNIRLSAASIARDVLGNRTTEPPARHADSFFELAIRIEGWLSHGNA